MVIGSPPRNKVLDDALDAAVLARGVTPFEQNKDLVAATDEMALQLDQLDLQGLKLCLVVLA